MSRPFSIVAKVLSQMESTTKRMEKTAYLAAYLRNLPLEDANELFLLQGNPFAEWHNITLQVANQTVIKAMSQSYGYDTKHIVAQWQTLGDLGLVAQELSGANRQQTLFSQELTSKHALETFQKIAKQSGAKSVQSKLALVGDLLSGADGLEAKYIIRMLLDTMRTGSAQALFRDAFLWSVFPGLVLDLYKQDKEHPVDKYQQFLEESGVLQLIQTEKQVHTSTQDFFDALNKTNSKDYQVHSGADTAMCREVYNMLAKMLQHGLDMRNDLVEVYISLRRDGIFTVAQSSPLLGRPLKSMLSQRAPSLQKGLEAVGVPAYVEYKYDGFRVQIHIGKQKDGSKKVQIFTRNLEEVTRQFPDVVELASALKVDSAILDAEVVAVDQATGKYKPFQEISQRIKRKHDIESMQKKVPIELCVFDILMYNDDSMLQEPLEKRRSLFEGILKKTPQKQVHASQLLISSDEQEINSFYAKSLSSGNEGIMIKSKDGDYQPGNRVGTMLKYKPVMDTLDLIVVGAQWGEGKRANWITSFVVACRDDDGNLLTIGKVSTGLKEQEEQGVSFAEMTRIIEPLIVSQESKNIKVSPSVVIEVAFEEIQVSKQYDSGYALRFPRFIALRNRKSEDISSLEYIQEMFGDQFE